MNRTITSNIAGYVFHIDENAYEKLDAYLKTIRSYFADSQGRDEIIADIEARLAEMLHERIGDMKQVVTLEDVNHAILIMGQPESFVDDDPETASWVGHGSESKSSASKRLFRDPDNRVVGGVCSGVSNYLGIEDPIWIRLALVISMFAFGSGFMLYLILWIIIPEARTTAEKLQMRGENVTVSNIEKKVNEELEAVKGKWNQMNGNRGAARRVSNAFHRLITILISITTMFIRFVGKMFGVLFLVVGLIGFLAVLSLPMGLPTMISWGNDGVISNTDVQQLIGNLVGGTGMLTAVVIAGVLVIGIPLVAMAFLGTRLLFGFRGRLKSVSLAFSGLWVIGIVMSFALAIIIASDFSIEGSDTETVELELNTDPTQVIHLALNHELGEDEPSMEATIFNLNLVTTGHSTLLYGKPEFDINMAKTGGPKLVIKRLANAKKKQDAMERASKIDYGFVMNDTALLLNGYFAIPKEELWRTQEVKIELLLPVGYTVFLSEEMNRIIYDIDNVSNTLDSKMVGRRWTMTPEGLACVDCEGLKLPKRKASATGSDAKDRQRELELEHQRLELEMEMKERELERIQEDLERERKNTGDEPEETSNGQGEIIIKRVINASYWISPTTLKNVTVSFPG